MNPWVDGNDLQEVIGTHGGITTYRWRDSRVLVSVDDTTNEIVSIWEE